MNIHLTIIKKTQKMENMKYLMRRAAVLLLAVTALAACGGDDDDDNIDPKTYPSELCGVWKITKLAIADKNGKESVYTNYKNFDIDDAPVIRLDASASLYQYLKVEDVLGPVNVGNWYVQNNNLYFNIKDYDEDNNVVWDLERYSLVTYNGSMFVFSMTETEGENAGYRYTYTVEKITESEAMVFAKEYYDWWETK